MTITDKTPKFIFPIDLTTGMVCPINVEKIVTIDPRPGGGCHIYINGDKKRTVRQSQSEIDGMISD